MGQLKRVSMCLFYLLYVLVPKMGSLCLMCLFLQVCKCNNFDDLLRTAFQSHDELRSALTMPHLVYHLFVWSLCYLMSMVILYLFVCPVHCLLLLLGISHTSVRTPQRRTESPCRSPAGPSQTSRPPVSTSTDRRPVIGCAVRLGWLELPEPTLTDIKITH